MKKVSSHLWFDSQAEDAARFYTALFNHSTIGTITRYSKGTIKQAAFTPGGQQFLAMDSAHAHAFTCNEAISFLVRCETQAEIDHCWDRLSAGGDPQAQQCGWLKDRFGVSWQVAPTALEQMLHDADTATVERVTHAFLKMRKLDLMALRRAYEGLVPVT